MHKEKYLLLLLIYYYSDFHNNINATMKSNIICLPIIFSGELWRIILSLFTHYNFIHLLSNYIIFFILNMLAKKLLNNILFIYIFLITSILGNIICLFLNNSNILILGISTGIYGIFGTFFFLINIHSKTSIYIFKYFILFINFFFIIQFILPFSFFNDNYLHLIGFFLGICIIKIKK